jgi:hypothetical protein
MWDADPMREEIEHLCTLSALNAHPKVLAEIEALIRELERSTGAATGSDQL